MAYKEQIRNRNLPERKTEPGHTGIPHRMRTQFEAFSGLSFEDVRIHYGSEKPAQLQAYAYTQGNDVYLGPGQERHLPHELGHVVQQKKGKVPATHFLAGQPVNADERMERLADSFAQSALGRFAFREPYRQAVPAGGPSPGGGMPLSGEDFPAGEIFPVREISLAKGASAAGQPVQRLRITYLNPLRNEVPAERESEEEVPAERESEEKELAEEESEEEKAEEREPEEEKAEQKDAGAVSEGPKPEAAPKVSVPEAALAVPVRGGVSHTFAGIDSVGGILSLFSDSVGSPEEIYLPWDKLHPKVQMELRDMVPEEAPRSGGKSLVFPAFALDRGRKREFVVMVEPEEWYVFTQGGYRLPAEWKEVLLDESSNQLAQMEMIVREMYGKVSLNLCIVMKQLEMGEQARQKSSKDRKAAARAREAAERARNAAANKALDFFIGRMGGDREDWIEQKGTEKSVIALRMNRKTKQTVKVVSGAEYKRFGMKRWMEMPSFATGDQFAVLAALMADPTLSLLIVVYDLKDNGWPQLFRLLAEKSGMEPREPEQAGLIALAENPVTNQRIKVVAAGAYKRPSEERRASKVSEATNTVAERYNREVRLRFRSAGGLNEVDGRRDEALVSWMENRWPELPGLIKKDNNFIILWIRLSGRNGEAHPEHDTGFGAMKLLIEELNSSAILRPAVILLAGDDYGGKAQRLANPNEKIFNMTMFWREESAASIPGTSHGGMPVQKPVPRLRPALAFDSRSAPLPGSSPAPIFSSRSAPLRISDWGGDERIGQARVYDYIARKAKSIRHIGSRSGNLELMSLIGHTVFYLEEQNSIGGERMTAYHRHDEGIPLSSPDRLNYNRIFIPRPLTFKGDFERGAMDYCVRTIKAGNKKAVTEMFSMLLPPELQSEIGVFTEKTLLWERYKSGREQSKVKGPSSEAPPPKGAKGPGIIPEQYFFPKKELEAYKGILMESRMKILKLMKDRSVSGQNIMKAISGSFLARVMGELCRLAEIKEIDLDGGSPGTAQYPEVPGMEFEFRKYLEQLFMLVAVIRKERLAEEQIREAAAGGMEQTPPHPQAPKFLKGRGWYGEFTTRIVAALEAQAPDSQ